MIPSPAKLGLAKLKSWRANQPEAIDAILNAPTPVVVAALPPGAGKSAIYMGLALHKDWRICVVTATRALQTQVSFEFARPGLTDVKGQANYDCLVTPTTVDQGPCHLGATCTYKSRGCDYFDRIRRAAKDDVTTNYSMHFARGHEFGLFDLTVFDEAHAAADELARQLSITFTRREVDEYFHRIPLRNWKPWAEYQKALFRSEFDFFKKIKEKTEAQWIRQNKIEELLRKVTALASADEHAYVYEKKAASWHWDCVWPGARRGMLFRGAKKYLLTSGTITKKHMSLLGFSENEYTFIEFDSTFPVSRRPIYSVPAPSMKASSGRSDYETWVRRIDAIIETRSKRKGIIHVGSYARAEHLIEHSKFGPRFFANRNPRELASVLGNFRAAKSGVLVSPSITAGVDFPYEACTFQIIAKLPFGDQRTPVNIEREKLDRDYAMFATAQEIVQASGRGMRAEDDFCETFIVDGNWDAWFYERSWKFFPRWWRKAVQRLSAIPNPPTIRSVFGDRTALRIET